MTTATTQIAQHLNVVETAIVRVEEWAKVLFVVVKGLGARFVSKKVVKMELAQLQGSEKQVAWAEKIRNKAINRINQVRKVIEAKKVRLKPTPEAIAALEERKAQELNNLTLVAEIISSQKEAKFWIESEAFVSDWSDFELVKRVVDSYNAKS